MGRTGLIAVDHAKVKDLRAMLQDRKLASSGVKAELVKRLVVHRKDKGARGDDLRFMKAPRKRRPPNQPVVLDVPHDDEPAEEIHVPCHPVPAAAGEVMQASTDVRIAGAKDQAHRD